MSRSRICALLALATLWTPARASAQVDLGRLGRLLAVQARSSLAASARPLPALFARGRGGGVSLIVHAPQGAPSEPGLAAIGDYAAGELSLGRFLELSQAHPDWTFDWAPPRHALLDRVDGWVHAASVRKTTHTSGQGVVVGIVDTGVDLTHPDLRTADGKTRVAWLFDASVGRAQVHPELESAYGCDVKPGCAVYAAADLDVLTSNDIGGDEPYDPFGHGTHVASLAAGNGLASPTPRYIGIAPEATLVVARVAQANGGILDADVLRGVKFVFDRAEELGMPAVVNLSLGSDFGAHDGTSALEMGLSSMVGPAFPGRAIVVAAGNSAGLYDGVGQSLPGPFGIHSEVHVPRASLTRVPLLTPAVSGDTVSGTAYVWIAFRAGDEVSVGVDDQSGTLMAPVPVAEGRSVTIGDVSVTVLNGTTSDAATTGVSPGHGSAVISIDGKWQANRKFSIHLEGHGTAELWLQGEGDLNAETGLGALFSHGQKEGTINVPAAAPGLIAVGATLNRTTWVDVEGNAVDMPNVGSIDDAPLDTIAYFSSAGPNALGTVKPDIVAPGVYVAGAMARTADPRTTSNDLFASLGRCPAEEDCFVVDDKHAITSGTSMSAPVVSGAIALLFQRDPTLTQDAARAILQAGARTLQGTVIDARQIGPGALDLEGALSIATAGDSPALRTPTSHSWLTLSASHAHPDPHWLVTGFIDLRDDQGNFADGFAPLRLRLSAAPAVLDEDLTRVAPGFYRFAVSAPADSGGQKMHVAITFDEQVIASGELPIAADLAIASGDISAAGGCAVRAPGRRAPSWAALAALVAVLFGRRVAMRRRRLGRAGPRSVTITPTHPAKA